MEVLTARIADIRRKLDALYRERDERYIDDEAFLYWRRERNRLRSIERLSEAEHAWLKDVRQRMFQRAPDDIRPLPSDERGRLGKQRRTSDRQWVNTLLKILNRFEPESFDESERAMIQECQKYLDESRLY